MTLLVLLTVTAGATAFVAADYTGLEEYLACPHTCPSNGQPIPNPPLPAPANGTVLAALGGPSGDQPVVYLAFNVTGSTGATPPRLVETDAAVNITCGAPAGPSGAEFTCRVALIRGPVNTATVDQLWSQSFTGTHVSRNSSLAPGMYWLLVDVHVGTPPAAVTFAPFDVSCQAVEFA